MGTPIQVYLFFVGISILMPFFVTWLCISKEENRRKALREKGIKDWRKDTEALKSLEAEHSKLNKKLSVELINSGNLEKKKFEKKSVSRLAKAPYKTGKLYQLRTKKNFPPLVIFTHEVKFCDNKKYWEKTTRQVSVHQDEVLLCVDCFDIDYSELGDWYVGIFVYKSWLIILDQGWLQEFNES